MSVVNKLSAADKNRRFLESVINGLRNTNNTSYLQRKRYLANSLQALLDATESPNDATKEQLDEAIALVIGCLNTSVGELKTAFDKLVEHRETLKSEENKTFLNVGAACIIISVMLVGVLAATCIPLMLSIGAAATIAIIAVVFTTLFASGVTMLAIGQRSGTAQKLSRIKHGIKVLKGKESKHGLSIFKVPAEDSKTPQETQPYHVPHEQVVIKIPKL